MRWPYTDTSRGRSYSSWHGCSRGSCGNNNFPRTFFTTNFFDCLSFTKCWAHLLKLSQHAAIFGTKQNFPLAIELTKEDVGLSKENGGIQTQPHTYIVGGLLCFASFMHVSGRGDPRRTHILFRSKLTEVQALSIIYRSTVVLRITALDLQNGLWNTECLYSYKGYEVYKSKGFYLLCTTEVQTLMPYPYNLPALMAARRSPGRNDWAGNAEHAVDDKRPIFFQQSGYSLRFIESKGLCLCRAEIKNAAVRARVPLFPDQELLHAHNTQNIHETRSEMNQLMWISDRSRHKKNRTCSRSSIRRGV